MPQGFAGGTFFMTATASHLAIVATFYSSARNVLPEFAEAGRVSCETVGQLGQTFLNGGGSGHTYMAKLARWSLLYGATVTSCPTTGLRQVEGNEPYSIALVTPNIFRRMKFLQQGDYVNIEVGGVGTIQEFDDNDDYDMERHPHHRRPVVVYNPHVAALGGGLYDQYLAHVRMEVDLGIRPKSSWDRIRISATPQGKADHIKAVQAQFDAMKKKDVSAYRKGSWTHVDEKSGIVTLPNGDISALTRQMTVPREDLVAIVGTSTENIELNPAMKGVIEHTIPRIMDELQRMGKKVICINSSTGINAVVLAAAARRGILHMALMTRAQQADGKNIYHAENIPVGIFDSRQQLAGYIQRKSGYMFCLPGATRFVADHVCDVSINIPMDKRPFTVVLDENGYYNALFQQYDDLALPIYARNHDGSMIGLASTQKIMAGICRAQKPGDLDAAFKIMRREAPLPALPQAYNHSNHSIPIINEIRQQIGGRDLSLKDEPDSWKLIREVAIHPKSSSPDAVRLRRRQEVARRFIRLHAKALGLTR